MDSAFEMAIFLGANKNTSYRKAVIEEFTSMFTFFKNNGLMLVDPLDSEGIIKLDLMVYEADFTPTGWAVWKDAYIRWIGARDRDGNYSDMRIFEKSLEKINKKQSAS